MFFGYIFQKFGVFSICISIISVIATASPPQRKSTSILYPVPLLKGVVADQYNNRLSNVLVTLQRASNLSTVASTYTTSDGYFYLTQFMIDYSGYCLLITPPEGSSLPAQYWMPHEMTLSRPQSPIHLTEYSDCSVRITVSSTPNQNSVPQTLFYGSIQGTCRDQNNSPLNGLMIVALFEDSKMMAGHTITSGSGDFLIPNLPTNQKVYLNILSSDPNLVVQGQFWSPFGSSQNSWYAYTITSFNTVHCDTVFVSLNPQIMLSQKSTLRIAINDLQNNPLSVSGKITLKKDNTTLAYYLPANLPTSEISCTSLLPGNYSLFLEINGFPHQYYSLSGNTTTPISTITISQTEQQISVNMKNTPKKTGRVSIMGTIKNDLGITLSGIKVRLMDTFQVKNQNTISLMNSYAYDTTSTDSTGTYYFREANQQAYYCIAGSSSSPYIAMLYPGVLKKKDAQMIIVSDTTSIRTAHFTLTRGCQVTGKVTDTLNRGLDSLRISLYPRSDSSQSEFNSFCYETISNQLGSFTVNGIPPGSWYVEVYDELQRYYRNPFDSYEIIMTSGTTISTLKKPLIMLSGGRLAGTYTAPQNTELYHSLGLLSLYPANLSSPINPKDNYFDQSYLSLSISDTIGRYVSSVLPTGSWIIVLIPPVPMEGINQQNNTLNFVPSLSWSYIDHAATLASTKAVSITPFTKTTQPITVTSGGYTLFGTISSQNNDTFGLQTVSGTYKKWYSVHAYIKDMGHLIKVSQSTDYGNHRFALPGLINGQSYFISIHADNYSSQWWTNLKDSSTALPDHASAYSFSTSSFIPLSLCIQKYPEGWEQNNNQGPSAITELKISAKGLNCFSVSWKPCQKSDSVKSYTIYRVRNATESLFVKKDYHWEPMNEDSIMKLVDSFSVSDTFLIDTTVQPLIQYMYVIFGVDTKNRSGEALPISVPLKTYMKTIEYSSFPSQANVNALSWYMLGVSGADSITPKKLFPNDTCTLFQWDPTKDSTKLLSRYSSISTIKPKTSAWFYSTRQTTITMSSTAFTRLCAISDSLTVHLMKGWNQISSPYPYPVAPQWLTSEQYSCYVWNASFNKYELAKQLKPWQGAWIYADEQSTLKVSSTPSLTNQTILSRISIRNGWKIKVNRIASKSSDPDNYIGVRYDNNTNATTIHEPPPAFDYPYIYFVKDNTQYSTIFLNASNIVEGQMQWTVGLSPSQEQTVITFDTLSGISDTIGIYWTDNKTIRDLRKNNSIAIQPSSEHTYATIVATSRQIDHTLFSGTMLLKQNYPNPFTNATRFEFVIPYLWNTNGALLADQQQQTTLSIYNSSGKCVATLFSGMKKPGIYHCLWQGKNTNGNALANGIYFARLHCSNSVKTIKLCKMF